MDKPKQRGREKRVMIQIRINRPCCLKYKRQKIYMVEGGVSEMKNELHEGKRKRQRKSERNLLSVPSE